HLVDVALGEGDEVGPGGGESVHRGVGGRVVVAAGGEGASERVLPGRKHVDGIVADRAQRDAGDFFDLGDGAVGVGEDAGEDAVGDGGLVEAAAAAGD